MPYVQNEEVIFIFTPCFHGVVCYDVPLYIDAINLYRARLKTQLLLATTVAI
jgi:hypothetical protein